jgi:glycosyltransferase involved in cell wall biosynthesis
MANKFLKYTSLVIACVILLVSLLFISIELYTNLNYKNFTNNIKVTKLNNKKILMLYTPEGRGGGSSTNTINLYRYLISNGYNVTILVSNNIPARKEFFDPLKLSYYSCRLPGKKPQNFIQELLLAYILYKVCKRENISIIHTNIVGESIAAKLVSLFLPVRVVMTLHIDNLHTGNFLKNLDGIIAVSPQIASLIKEENKKRALNIKKIEFIFPFIDTDKFLSFTPKFTKQEFFKKYFNISLDNNIPIICMVGHFYPNPLWKNHKLLIRAINKIIYEHKQKVYLMLAGGGPRLEESKELAHELKVQDYVFFLKYTKFIPELLYYSDIKTLTSAIEAFPLSLLEAALMKKALIGTAHTGIENIIINNKTGLLFNKNNLEDLTQKLLILLNNPQLRKTLGNSAYNFVLQNYMPEVSIKKIGKFYEEILKLS